MWLKPAEIPHIEMDNREETEADHEPEVAGQLPQRPVASSEAMDNVLAFLGRTEVPSPEEIIVEDASIGSSEDIDPPW